MAAVARWRAGTPKVAPEPAVLKSPRVRRTSAEVRRLILDAAQQLFAANGFRGTSTREIAQTAGVAEVLLFRNFGSKAELYSTAVVLPLTEFLDEWLERDWSGWDQQTTEEQQREFIARMYQIVADNRGLIMSYLAMSVFEPELIMGLEHSQALDRALDRIADRADQHLGRLGRSGPNARIGTRAVVGMIVAMALFRDFGSASASKRPSRDAVIDEMTEMVLHGALHRAPAAKAAPAAKRRRSAR